MSNITKEQMIEIEKLASIGKAAEILSDLLLMDEKINFQELMIFVEAITLRNLKEKRAGQ